MDNKEVLALVKDLIDISSISGTEEKVASFIESKFLSLGMKSERTPSGCVCGIVEGTTPGPTVLMDGHIDTVGIPDITKWKHDPFKATLEDGKLYGRGTSDMKGSVGCLIAAASSFVGKEFPGRIIVSCIVEEERFEGICAREVSERYKPDYVIIGEATSGKLNIGQRGRCEILLESSGKSCHSSNPEEGDNAVLNMMEAIRILSSLPEKVHPVLGKGIMVLTDIISTPYPGASVIPEKCSVTYDRRTLVGETPESVLEPINTLLKEKGAKAEARIAYGSTDSYTGHHLEALRFFPAWLYDTESEVVKRARKGLDSVGLFKEYSHYSFCTNGSHYAGEANIPTIGYGPGEEKLAHIVDEYVPEKDLYEVHEGLKGILNGLLGIV